MQGLVKLFGEEWLTECVLPTISECARRTGPSGFLGRITALQAAGALAAVLPAGVLADVILPQVFNMGALPVCVCVCVCVRVSERDRQIDREMPVYGCSCHLAFQCSCMSCQRKNVCK
jgi:hypothetical protein